MVSKEEKDSESISVVCTIFPIYDWMREITGGSDAMDLHYLINNGEDAHNYAMTAEDMLKVKNSDILICVGGESDEWITDLETKGELKNTKVIRLMGYLGDKLLKEPEIQGVVDTEESEHEDEYDEHIWTSIRNTKVVVSELTKELMEYNTANKEEYRYNGTKYLVELDKLDEEYTNALSVIPNKSIIFPDKFPFVYLFNDYEIGYYAAFNGCSAESEASFETIAFLSSKLNELNSKSVFVLEGSDKSIANTVIKESKRDNINIVTLNPMDTVSQEDPEYLSYIELMKNNLEVLKANIN